MNSGKSLRCAQTGTQREFSVDETYAFAELDSDEPQYAQRVAAAGMSLRHSGHFFLSGGASFLKRAMNEFMGSTMK